MSTILRRSTLVPEMMEARKMFRTIGILTQYLRVRDLSLTYSTLSVGMSVIASMRRRVGRNSESKSDLVLSAALSASPP